jgi:filamentous hemagglutinin
MVKKIWIDGNATKHIAEYAAVKAENFSPEMVRLVSQEQIRSLSSAVTTAVDTGIQYRKMMHVDGWELIFAPPKSANQLPALYHALYKRK